jgi:hypothetical protein
MKIRPPTPREQLGMMLLGYLLAGLVDAVRRYVENRVEVAVTLDRLHRDESQVFFDLQHVPPGYTQTQVDAYLHWFGRDTPGLN